MARHRGSARAVSIKLGVSAQSVSLWLQGRMESKRIADACQRKADECLAEERKIEKINC